MARPEKKNGTASRTWRRLGLLGIVFFTLKGVLWLLVPAILVSIL